MLINADARQIPLSDQSVQMVVTSPPYNVGVGYDAWDDNLSFQDYWEFMLLWLKECYRVLVPSGRIAINVPNIGNSSDFGGKGKGVIAHMPLTITAMQEAGFQIRDCITWFKTHDESIDEVEQSFCGNNTAWGSWQSPSNPFCRSFSEFIVVAHKESPTLAWKGHSDLAREEFMLWTRNVWLMATVSNPEHPAPFPLELPSRLIKLYTYPGDLILDPFSGTGTTVKAAHQLNRRAIGLDLSPNYLVRAQYEVSVQSGNFELAQQIIRRPRETAISDLPMFREEPA